MTCETENAVNVMPMLIFSPFFDWVSPYAADASADAEVPVPYAEAARKKTVPYPPIFEII